MVMRESTKRKWKRIADDFEKTRDISHVMEKYGVSNRLVRLACSEMGVKIEGSVGKPPGRLKTDTWNVLRELIKGVRTQADIAEEFGMSVSRVKKIKKQMKDNKVLEALDFVRQNGDHVDELDVITSFLRGLTAVEISDELNVSAGRIEDVIDRARDFGLLRAAKTYSSKSTTRAKKKTKKKAAKKTRK